MYSGEELERSYLLCQTKALPHGESVQSSYARKKVPYNIFSKWYGEMRSLIVEVCYMFATKWSCRRSVPKANHVFDKAVKTEQKPVPRFSQFDTRKYRRAHRHPLKSEPII